MKHHKQLQIEPNILKDPKESRRILKNPENFLNIPSNFKLSLILNHWNITNSFKLNQRFQRILKNPEGSQRIPMNRRISFQIGNFRQWLTIEPQNQLQMKPGIPKHPAGSGRNNPIMAQSKRNQTMNCKRVREKMALTKTILKGSQSTQCWPQPWNPFRILSGSLSGCPSGWWRWPLIE